MMSSSPSKKLSSPPNPVGRNTNLPAFLLILSLSIAQVVIHNWFVDSRVKDAQVSLHNQVISKEAPAPIQYRIFVHYIAEGLMKYVGFSFLTSYNLIRFLFTFLSMYLFYFFLKEWFTPTESLLGTLFFIAILPFTYIRYYFQPMDIPNLFFFITGLFAARKKKFILFLIILAIAMTNRETAILLILVWFFTNWGIRKNKDVLIETAIATAIGLGIYFYLRKIFTLKSYYSDLFYLRFNLTDGRTYLYALITLGAFAYYGLKNFSSKPLFLRRLILIAPFFIVIHYTMTIMVEPRLWLPLIAVIIPLGLWEITDEKKKNTDVNTTIIAQNNKKLAIQYLALLGSFILFFYAFFAWYKKAHLGNRRDYLLSEEILSKATRLTEGGWVQGAAEELVRGAQLFPEKSEFHYQLGLLYAYRIFNYEKALEHFKKTLALEPHHLDSRRIISEIERLEYYQQKGKTK